MGRNHSSANMLCGVVLDRRLPTKLLLCYTKVYISCYWNWVYIISDPAVFSLPDCSNFCDKFQLDFHKHTAEIPPHCKTCANKKRNLDTFTCFRFFHLRTFFPSFHIIACEKNVLIAIKM